MLVLFLLAFLQPAKGDAPVIPREILIPKEVLVIASGARGGRTPVRTDPVEALLVSGMWKTPKEGDTLEGLPRVKWEKVQAAANGSFRHPALAGGYALWKVESDSIQTMVLEAEGHGMVYVNGEPRPGDPYRYGNLALPVALKKGVNEFLFFGGRGAILAKLQKPAALIEILTTDPTLPDLVAKKAGTPVGAVVVRNCSEKPLLGLSIRAKVGEESRTAPVAPIPGHSIFKVPFPFAHGELPEGKANLVVELFQGNDSKAKGQFSLDVKSDRATRKVTFTSLIDGSTQYFGLVPSSSLDEKSENRPGILLTLHGASVEGIGQAAAYGAKSWAHIVAPTNRRPYGFDWEDWGRMDALEVLEVAQKTLLTDPRKVWLTGHSMGGHGVWHMGVTFPDRFAAIAPSAGWISMFSYAGARRPESKAPVAKVLSRATNVADTLELLKNLKTRGTYILHGDQDDNVPVGQARAMRAKLGEFHPDFSYHEQPGAGHWWGNECVDWPPLMRFLSERPKLAPETVVEVDFRTFHPGISSKMAWATIEAQEMWGELSEIQIKADPAKGTILGTTRNVQRLSLSNPGWAKKDSWSLMLDGQTMDAKDFGKTDPIRLEWRDKKWSILPPLDLKHLTKTAGQAGPIKEAFRGRMAYIVGVSGTPEESRTNWSKARFDAETFYYRGNGAIEIYTDVQWEKSTDRMKGRNLILLGNEDNNRAIKKLFADSPIRVQTGQIEWPGGKLIEGNDKATLFLRPRQDDPGAFLVCLGATGPSGMRLLERTSLWVSGSSFPDYLMMEPALLKEGTGGFIAAGYFATDWGFDPKQAGVR